MGRVVEKEAIFALGVQALLLATGFIEVLAAVTAAIFVGFWIYAVVRGGQLDAAQRAAQA